MGMDGMAREDIPEQIEEQLDTVEREASKLSELFDKYGHSVSEAPIYVACDEVRDALASALGEAESEDQS